MNRLNFRGSFKRKQAFDGGFIRKYNHKYKTYMPNPELVEYVKSELARGVSAGDVRSSLLVQGWPLADIDTAFHAAGIGSNMAASAAHLTSTQSLASVGELFTRAGEIFKKRWAVLLGVLVLGGVPVAVLFVGVVAFGTVSILSIAQGSSFDITILVGAGVGVLIVALLGLWLGAAMLYAVRDDMVDNGVVGSYRYGWNKIPALFWVSVLSMFAVLGGVFLAIVPGVIAAVWLIATRFIVVVEGDRGIYALAKSKAYVTGRWWAVLGRTAAALAVILVINVAMSTMVDVISAPGAHIGAQVVSFVVTVFANLYMLAYSYALYSSLRESRLEVSARTDHPRGALNLFIGVSFFIMVALACLIVYSTKSFGW